MWKRIGYGVPRAPRPKLRIDLERKRVVAGRALAASNLGSMSEAAAVRARDREMGEQKC